MYENSTTVRNTTVDVRRHTTTGHQGEKSVVGMQTLPRPFVPHLPQRRQACGPVYIASFWQLTEPFQCQLPVRWIMTGGLLSGPSTTWIQMPPGHKGNKCQQRTKDLLSFLTGAEMRNRQWSWSRLVFWGWMWPQNLRKSVAIPCPS